MTTQKQPTSRVIGDIKDIRKYPLGTVIAGKDGRVFNAQSDYYKIGLITPLLNCGFELVVLTQMLDAAERCYTPALIHEISTRARETDDLEYHKDMPREIRDISPYHPSCYSKLCPQEKLLGMPRNRSLYTFRAPVPEDAGLAERVADEFEKALMENVYFIKLVERWRK